MASATAPVPRNYLLIFLGTGFPVGAWCVGGVF